MNWYYASGGKPVGPLSETEWTALLANGTIKPDTLVWHEEMENWQPFAAVPARASSGAAEGRCAKCGGTFKAEDLTASDGELSCAACLEETQPADVETLSARLAAGTYQLDIQSNLERAWAVVRGNFWPCFGVTLLGYTLMLLTSRIPIVQVLAAFCVQPQITAGLYWYFLRQIRGEPAGLPDLFEGFRRGFAQQLLYVLITFGVIFAFALSAGLLENASRPAHHTLNPTLELILGLGIGALGLALAALIISWIFAPILILDQNFHAIDAMRLSQRAVRRVFWKFLLLLLTLGALALAGLVVLVVGVFLVLPVVFATMARTYEDLFGKTTARPGSETPLS